MNDPKISVSIGSTYYVAYCVACNFIYDWRVLVFCYFRDYTVDMKMKTPRSPEEIARAVFKECADYWSMGTPAEGNDEECITIIAAAIQAEREPTIAEMVQTLKDFYGPASDLLKTPEKVSDRIQPASETSDYTLSGIESTRSHTIIPDQVYLKKIVEALEYCEPHLDQMWAARISAILLDCDFRETTFIKATLREMKATPHKEEIPHRFNLASTVTSSKLTTLTSSDSFDEWWFKQKQNEFLARGGPSYEYDKDCWNAALAQKIKLPEKKPCSIVSHERFEEVRNEGYNAAIEDVKKMNGID